MNKFFNQVFAQNKLAEKEHFNYRANHKEFSAYNLKEIIGYDKVLISGKVADLASGLGGNSFQLLRFKGVTQVVGFDIADLCIKESNKRYKNSKIKFITADIEKLDRKYKGYFDCVTFFSALHHFPDCRKVVKTTNFILKNGGIVWFVEPISINIQYFAYYFVKFYRILNFLVLSKIGKHTKKKDYISDNINEIVHPLGYYLKQFRNYEILEKKLISMPEGFHEIDKVNKKIHSEKAKKNLSLYSFLKKYYLILNDYVNKDPKSCSVIVRKHE